MSETIVTKVSFERAQLVLEGTGCPDNPPCIRNGNSKIKPSYTECDGENFRIEYDIISGNNQYPLSSGLWYIDLKGSFETVNMDYSAHKVLYKLRVSDGPMICIKAEYNPANITGIRLVIFPILKLAFFISTSLLRFLFNLSRFIHSGKNIALFTSESRDLLGGNMAYVVDKAKQLGLDRRYIFKYSFLDKKNHSSVRYAVFLLRTAFMLGRANIVVIDDYHPLIYQMKFKSNVKVVQLWHACGAFKAVGYARCGKNGAPTISNHSHRNYTHAIVSGEGVRRCYSEAFGIPLEKVYACGVPRTDEFFEDNYKQYAQEEIDQLYPNLKDKSKILFAPTFRGHGKQSAYYPLDKIDFDKLEQLCRKTNRAVLFKMHPFVKEKIPIREDQEDIFADVGQYPDINKMIACSEVLITDYSSSIYEAALLGTPMVFYVFDLDEYISNRAFFKPFNHYLSGKVVDNFDALVEVIENKDYDQDKRQRLIDSSVEKCDGNASERVAKLIFQDD